MYKSFISFISIFLFLFSILFADDIAHLYKLKKPNKEILNWIEQSGGVVDRYIPEKTAEVYLTRELVEQIESQGYQLHLIDQQSLLSIVSDSLSSDHTVGLSYHSYPAVTFILDSLLMLYPDICKVVSIGQTVEGREMWAILITDKPNIEEIEPEVKYVANMHGDEMISQEMMLILTKYLLQNYDDSRIKQLIDETEIWIMPNMNFDGSQNLQRRNANNVDLNRNFPDRDPEYVNPNPLQAETVNMRDWSQAHNFVLSANFHSGQLVVNYPWDRNLDGSSNYSATPDDNTFIRLALSYAEENDPMYNSVHFTNGITNGAEWYQVTGGMMDWNYHFLSCMDLTIELSEEKMPRADSLSYFWENNRESMLTLLEQVHSGVRGTVTDSLTSEPLHAQVKVSEIGKSVYTDPDLGDYYRLLEPGTFQFLFEADGYYPKLIDDVSVDSGYVTQFDVLLRPIIYFTLYGNISDTTSAENLENVKIYIYQTESIIDSVTSDESGNYSVILPVGNYHLLIRKEDYFDKWLQLNLFEDTTLDLQLLKIIRGRISGSMLIMDNGNPDGSIIYCQNSTDTLFSENYFEIDSLMPGYIKIFAYKYGYKTSQIKTFLENGGSLDLKIPLWPGTNDYFTNFELLNNNFTGSGDWQRDFISYGPFSTYSGDFAWATNPHEDYTSARQIHSLETNIFSLQGMVIPTLELYHWYDIESNYDGANVKISDDYGQSWQILHPDPDYPLEALPDEFSNPMAGEPVYSGNIDTWDKISFNLSEYLDWPFVKFRFDLGVDEQKTSAGWYLDDFKIFDANATVIFSSIAEQTIKTLSVNIYPNPANPSTKFSILTAAATTVDISIFDIQGRLINKIILDTQPNHLLEWRWHGVNSFNKAVASGIYFARVENPQESVVRKIILIR